jgi:signal transduction histidine kinase
VVAIVLFCASVFVLVAVFYPRDRHAPDFVFGGELPPPSARLLASAYKAGGMAAVEDMVHERGELFPPDAWITLYHLDGTREVVFGDAAIGDPAEVRSALQGHGVNHGSLFRLDLSMTSPVRDETGRVIAAMSVEFGFGLSPQRRSVFARRLAVLLIGVLGGLGLCLALGLALSAAVVRPVEKLVEAIRRMDPARMEQRVPEEGPSELVTLSRSFNQLSAQLQASMAELRGQKEVAQRMESSRREFLADVSHNLRTPLTAIQGWLDALHDGLVAEPDVPRQLDKVQREVGHVIRTVSHLLDLARWESEDPRLVLETFPVLDAVMEVAETLEEAAGAAGVSLQFDDLKPSWRVRADRAKVREIFQILFENAVRYAGRGTTVHLAMAPVGGRLEIAVRDDGVGIPSEIVPHLRERYHRASSGGIGLGLAIVYKLVRAHGGEVTIESARDHGTRIEFSLPFVAT